jgi:Domain of unknown function (DUF5666)
MMIRSSIAALAVGLVLVPAAAAASPVQGSVFGPIVSVSGTSFTLTTTLSPSGKSLVSAGSARITEQATAPKSDLKVGACVMASGSKNSKGVVAATRISISAPVKGQCTVGFGRAGAGGGLGNRPGGVRPGGTGSGGSGSGQTPPSGGAGGFNRSGNFGFAFGSVTKMSGSTLTVKGSFGGKTQTTTVTVSSKTTLSETKTIKAADLKVKTCAFVRGTSNDKGKTVKATDITISPETGGKCTNGFRRPGS